MGSVENAPMESSSESPIEGQQNVGQAIESEAAAQNDASRYIYLLGKNTYHQCK